MAVSSKHSGFKKNPHTGVLEIYNEGTLVASISEAGVITFSGGVVLPQAVTIGSVAYTFPATDGSNTDQLTSNGSGVLAWLPADDGAA